MIQTGEELFSEGSCANCHGEGGSGGRFGPDLTDAAWVQGDGDLEGIRQVIFWGVRRRDFDDPDRRFEMNPQGGMDLEWTRSVRWRPTCGVSTTGPSCRSAESARGGRHISRRAPCIHALLRAVATKGVEICGAVPQRLELSEHSIRVELLHAGVVEWTVAVAARLAETLRRQDHDVIASRAAPRRVGGADDNRRRTP